MVGERKHDFNTPLWMIHFRVRAPLRGNLKSPRICPRLADLPGPRGPTTHYSPDFSLLLRCPPARPRHCSVASSQRTDLPSRVWEAPPARPARPHAKVAPRGASTAAWALTRRRWREGMSQPRAGPGAACRWTSGRILLTPGYGAGPGRGERDRGPLEPASPGAAPRPFSCRQAVAPVASQRARPDPPPEPLPVAAAPSGPSARLGSAQLLPLLSAPLD